MIVCNYDSGDDFQSIITNNIDQSIANFQSIIPDNIELASSESPQVATAIKKKRKQYRKSKGSWFCESCRNFFDNKQALTTHMENIRICQKKQKRLEDAEQITLAPPH